MAHAAGKATDEVYSSAWRRKVKRVSLMCNRSDGPTFVLGQRWLELKMGNLNEFRVDDWACSGQFQSSLGQLGGDVPETKRARELSELLGVNIMASQVKVLHVYMNVEFSIFVVRVFDKWIVPFSCDGGCTRFENELIIATGKGDPALVMSEYGLKKAPTVPRYDVSSERVMAAFVVSDPVDWGRDIQALCDVLRSGGLPGDANRYGISNASRSPLHHFGTKLADLSANYVMQVAFPSKRLGMGAFRIAPESVYNKTNPKSLEYITYGKPNPFVFKNAEIILRQHQSSSCRDHSENDGVPGSHPFKTLYMSTTGHVFSEEKIIILNSRQIWQVDHSIPILENVVGPVEEAVHYILKRVLNPKLNSIGQYS
ncbi:Hydrolase family protein / HAD-superfamily protein isoform 2 [Hibiscus syriacus]|uniref:Hydrolase family protein / HAD-superfamily protein isoform 2 n=1 Tax=Hibiscus syriacus TaxID=106335 RepID=A0A6A2ZJ39_HIBSY|nr:Hydrolase family protein / HAD-superfamily protein isoform 2 [Hibiscus syriacus]